MAPVRENTVVVRGYRELQLAFKQAEAEINAGFRTELKAVGEIVRRDAAARMLSYDSRSAAGFRVQMHARSMWVAQTRRSKHIRPQFGALQMVKALLPALDAHRGEIMAGFEGILDKIIVSKFGL